jgi:hypothetical protein
MGGDSPIQAISLLEKRPLPNILLKKLLLNAQGGQ